MQVERQAVIALVSSNITSKIRIVVIFLNVDLKRKSLTLYRCAYIYLGTRFRKPSANGSLVIAIKPKAKHRYRAAAIFLFYVLRKKKKHLTKVT
jgi:hypothetical protein